MNAALTSWKTSLAGIAGAVGTLLVSGVSLSSILTAVGFALTGLLAQDHGVQTGAK